MRFEAYTPRTIVDPAALAAQLDLIRAQGYAVEDEEIMLGKRCVGAAILDAAGRAVAAISVAGPTYRLTRERVALLAPEIATIARHISLQLRLVAVAADDAGDGPRPIAEPAQPGDGASPCWDRRSGTLAWIEPALSRIVLRCGDGLHMIDAPEGARLLGLARAPTGEGWIVLSRDAAFHLAHGRLACADQFQGLRGALSVTAGAGALWCARPSKGGCEIARVTQEASATLAWLSAQALALVWSENEACLYAADAERGAIHRITAQGEVRLFARAPRVSGVPRGLGVDADGRLWAALDGGWTLARLTQEGDVDLVIGAPVPRPTGLAFGGANGRTMFIATTREGLSAARLAHAPASGPMPEFAMG